MIKNLTKEQHNASSRNKQRAWQYFIWTGEIPWDCEKGEYVMHHKDITLSETDPERYIEWRIEDLQVMTQSEHTRLHHKGKILTEDTKRKIGIGHLGKGHKPSEKQMKLLRERTGDKNPMYGKHYHWYNNGEKQIFTEECPIGFTPGRLKVN